MPTRQVRPRRYGSVPDAKPVNMRPFEMSDTAAIVLPIVKKLQDASGGWPVSLREIIGASDGAIKSTSTTSKIVAELVKLGHLEKHPTRGMVRVTS